MFPSGNHRLENPEFRQSSSGDWRLSLPTSYATLINQFEPTLMARSLPWRDSHHQGQKYTYLKSVSSHEQKRVDSFLRYFKQFVVVGKTATLDPSFTDEIFLCVALDMHVHTDSGRTETGQLEYEAKYRHSELALAGLAEHLQKAVPMLTCFRESNPAVLSYVPGERGKLDHFARVLAHRVADGLDAAWLGNVQTIVDAELTMPKASMKDAILSEKNATWSNIVQQEAIRLMQPVMGQAVIVVDDLLQSGTTLWWYARYLKNHGASRVIGLVSTKTRKDTDNVSGGSHPFINRRTEPWNSGNDIPF